MGPGNDSGVERGGDARETGAMLYPFLGFLDPGYKTMPPRVVSERDRFFPFMGRQAAERASGFEGDILGRLLAGMSSSSELSDAGGICRRGSLGDRVDLWP